MVERFVQLKKRAALQALLYAVVTGVFSAMLLFGGLFALFKRVQPDFPWYGYLLCCLGVFLLVGGGILLFTYPTTKRFAKYLDERFALGERVRTSVQFSGKEGAVLTLQREQTQALLSTLPKQKKGVLWAVKLFLLPILAIATLTGSFFVPKKQAATPPPYKEPVYETTLYNIKDLEALIANVQKSGLPEDMKGIYDTGLQALLALIQTEEPAQKEVIASVNSCMDLIVNATEEGNSYNAVLSAIEEVAALSPLSQALKESGRAYKLMEGVNLYSFATLENKEEALLALVSGEWKEYVDSLSTALAERTQEEYVVYATAYAGLLCDALEWAEVAALPQTDKIKVGLTAITRALQDSVADIEDAASGVPFATARANAILEMEYTYDINKEVSVVAALGGQAYNVMIRDYALQTLSSIFGVPLPTEEDEMLGGDSESVGGGVNGGGSGNLEYPDDGLVLDPTDGQYKPYGMLLAEYYKKVTELMESDPEMSEELKAYIKAYFEGLQTTEN